MCQTHSQIEVKSMQFNDESYENLVITDIREQLSLPDKVGDLLDHIKHLTKTGIPQNLKNSPRLLFSTLIREECHVLMGLYMKLRRYITLFLY